MNVAYNMDCLDGMKQLPDKSVDLTVTSIPFSNHYEYTASYNDFGHNESTDRFFDQMDYLSPQLLRILKPGRVFACHVKDRVLFGNATGYGMPTMEPFHAQCIQHYMKHGFAYFGMITVVTDVVRENNQTYRLGWTEQCKDGTKMGVGCPEYILLFRKLPTDRSKAYADEPVTKSKEDYTRAQWQIDAHVIRLLDAEDEGRLVVLPCKVGDRVWLIVQGMSSPMPVPVCSLTWRDGKWSINADREETEPPKVVGFQIGKTAFLTREEAEAALEGME